MEKDEIYEYGSVCLVTLLAALCIHVLVNRSSIIDGCIVSFYPERQALEFLRFSGLSLL